MMFYHPDAEAMRHHRLFLRYRSLGVGDPLCGSADPRLVRLDPSFTLISR